MLKMNIGSEVILDCVTPYIRDSDVLNAVSLVSKKFYELDCLTRKHLTVHVHNLPDSSRLRLRFPNIESLILKSYSPGFSLAYECHIPVTPWIQEISVMFQSLKSLSIWNMVVSVSDLKLLANTRGGSLQSLDIRCCKMFSEEGLVDIARDCIDLRSLRLNSNHIDGQANGKWLHELALHNTVMESLDFDYPFYHPFYNYDEEDVALLARKCSNSLVSLNASSRSLIDFKQVFKHAKKLDHYGTGIINKDEDYSGFEFPPNIRGLRFQYLHQASFPFLRPYLHQLRELVLTCVSTKPKCQCYFFKRCPNLEVLHTDDICKDIGWQLIGQFCKKLRKLTHRWEATQKGLIAVAQGCPELEYLDVSLVDISNEALKCVGTHLKNLRDFRIRCDREDDITYSPLENGIQALLMGCSKLERLYFRISPDGLTDASLGIIGKYGYNLRSLYLRCTGEESDVGLLELAKGCPKLRKLKFDGCLFSNQAIATLVFILNQSLMLIRVEDDNVVSSVLTRPLVSAEVHTKLYLKLAEKLLRLALQLVADGSDARFVKITYTSSRATDDTDTPLIRNMVANSIQNEERYTLGATSEKPLEIIVRIANVESRFATVVSQFGDIKLQGSVKDGVPHLTKVGAFEVDVSLEGNIILCRQVDQGITISRVTSILCERNVKINSMCVGSSPAPSKQAVMVIGIDGKLSDEALKKIGEIQAVEEFVFLAL